jgi:hypothetical protein
VGDALFFRACTIVSLPFELNTMTCRSPTGSRKNHQKNKDCEKDYLKATPQQRERANAILIESRKWRYHGFSPWRVSMSKCRNTFDQGTHMNGVTARYNQWRSHVSPNGGWNMSDGYMWFIVATFTSCGDYAKTPLSNGDCMIKTYLKYTQTNMDRYKEISYHSFMHNRYRLYTS